MGVRIKIMKNNTHYGHRNDRTGCVRTLSLICLHGVILDHLCFDSLKIKHTITSEFCTYILKYNATITTKMTNQGAGTNNTDSVRGHSV
jgi:hypothetical protein